MSLILAYQGLGKTVDVTIKDVNGDAITPGENDLVRATIGRAGETPVLTVTSDAPTANGSSFTKGAACRLRLDADDLGFAAGTYSLSVEYFDRADASEWKMIEKQVFQLEVS